jgi:hypothetical protein
MMHRSVARAVPVILATALLAACGADDPDAGRDAASQPAAASTSPSPEIDDAEPAAEIRRLLRLDRYAEEDYQG